MHEQGLRSPGRRGAGHAGYLRSMVAVAGAGGVRRMVKSELAGAIPVDGDGAPKTACRRLGCRETLTTRVVSRIFSLVRTHDKWKRSGRLTSPAAFSSLAPEEWIIRTDFAIDHLAFGSGHGCLGFRWTGMNRITICLTIPFDYRRWAQRRQPVIITRGSQTLRNGCAPDMSPAIRHGGRTRVGQDLDQVPLYWPAAIRVFRSRGNHRAAVVPKGQPAPVVAMARQNM